MRVCRTHCGTINSFIVHCTLSVQCCALGASAGPVRCLQALCVVAAFLAVEVNVFFLKYALWVPPTHPLNTARLLLWLLVGAPAVREYYEFIEVRSGRVRGVEGGVEGVWVCAVRGSTSTITLLEVASRSTRC